MATRDEKGYIRYSMEELNRIPPFEVRERVGMNGPEGRMLGALGGTAIGAGLGSVAGPAGAALGGVAGALAGGIAGDTLTGQEQRRTRR